jgi:signal transduction histidine kinase
METTGETRMETDADVMAEEAAIERAADTTTREEIERILSDPGRMTAVLRTGLLDSEPEDAFDRLTRIAARLTGAPVSFISVLDEGRDFYKSCFGFGEPLSTEREMTGRTFCHYAVVSDQPLVIPDTRAHPEYSTVPTVESLGVAAYLGIPLKTSDGQVIGSFCAVDFEPREWTHSDVEILTELAASSLREVELRAAMREAERVTESRARLVRGFSHDLKNPLGAAIGHAELLDGDLFGELQPRQRESVGRIRALLRNAIDLIDDVVELARAEAGDLDIRAEELDLRALAGELIDAYSAQVEAAGLSFTAELEPAYPGVRSDGRRVRQILGNLISNAIKYNLEGGRVVLRAVPRDEGAHLPGRGRWIAMEVEDTGRGIPAEQQELLFREFTRLDPEAAPGAGLGLAISRRIARMLGGEITFRSQPGEGTTFTLWIPVEGGAGARRG